jgi:hypothetical protein
MAWEGKGDYNAYGHKEKLKDNISELDIMTGYAISQLQAADKKGVAYQRSYWIAYKLVASLHRATISYVMNRLKNSERQGEVFPVTMMLNKPNPSNPKQLISGYDRYKALLVETGILDIGYFEDTLKDKMRNRT